MRQKKIQSVPALRVLQGERVRGLTCFAVHEKYDADCQRTTCRHWLDSAENNCVLIAVHSGERTLHEIGQMFDPPLSRMRICQIEKGIHEKIREASD